MSELLQKEMQRRRIPWVRYGPAPCSICGSRLGHAPWWSTIGPPSHWGRGDGG